MRDYDAIKAEIDELIKQGGKMYNCFVDFSKSNDIKDIQYLH